MTEFTTESDPSAVMEKLEEYKADANSDLIIESDEQRKFIKIEDKSKGLILKLKFFKFGQEEDEQVLKMRFVKKSGDLRDQYELISSLTVYLADIIINEDELAQ